MKIRLLTQEDWQPWKLFRLEALKNSLMSFGSSYEEEANWSDLDFQNGLTKSDIFMKRIYGENCTIPTRKQISKMYLKIMI